MKNLGVMKGRKYSKPIKETHARKEERKEGSRERGLVSVGHGV